MDLLVFDLDGTLIDSKLDLALSVNAVRADASLPPLAHETIYSYVGNGAPVLIRRALGPDASDRLAEDGLRYFYSYYREHMLDNTDLYPGVRAALDQLRDMGKQMAILTNKPVRFSQGIIAGLGLAPHFQEVLGGNSLETKKPDPEGLNKLMSQLGIGRARTLMVGDSAVDVETARNAKVLCCGVTYGLQPESFQQHPPDFLVDRFEEILPIIGNGAGRHSHQVSSES